MRDRDGKSMVSAVDSSSRTNGDRDGKPYAGIFGRIIESDAYLVEQILASNDRMAAHELIERHYRRVYKSIYIKIQDAELAKDLTQETFISVLKSLNQFDSKKASFRTWIDKIALNKIIDYKRGRQNKESMMTDVLMDYEEESPQRLDAEAVNSVTKDAVLEKLKDYDEDVGKIFLMRAEQGYSFIEIADIMDMSLSTVKNKYYSLVKKLRKELEGYE